MRWTWARLPELAVDDLYDALALRARVFVVEQACAFQDPDGTDRHAWHLVGRDENGVLTAYLRVVDAPETNPVRVEPVEAPLEVEPVRAELVEAPSIGRVVTAPEHRGAGLGRMLFAEGLARCLATWPGRGIRLNAQARLERFYAGFGFARAGPDFLEDGITHIPMWRSP